MTAPDELVWVAAVRRGITYHRIVRIGQLHTSCGRAMVTGQEVSRMRATHELAGEPCPRCQTAAGSCIRPADGTANAGSESVSGAAPTPTPAAATAGVGVSPVNDRLFEELLRPIVDSFYATAQSLARLPLPRPPFHPRLPPGPQ